MLGFSRISAAVPTCRVSDFHFNFQRTLSLWQQADEEGCDLVVFPELGLSAYTARDLLLDHHLLGACLNSLAELAIQGSDLAPMAIVGLPLRVGSALYNVAAAVQGGRILGVVPKAYLPNYREFEEARWFRPGIEVPESSTVEIAGESIPFGTDLLFVADNQPDLVVGIEICEDYWVQIPPSAFQVSAGATVICNLSASNFTVGKAELRRLLARSASDRGKSAYLYVAAGPGESSTDLAFDADAFICENGKELASSQRFSREDQLVSVDIDLELLIRERMATTTFGDCARHNALDFRRIGFRAAPAHERKSLQRHVPKHPFLPSDPRTLATRCWEIFEIQTNALVTRMQASGISKLVLGVSGGLDSTHAALVCAAALDLLGQDRSDLICVTMPGLGTTTQTRGNAELLADYLGGDFQEINVSTATQQVLHSVKHAAVEGVQDVEGLLQRLCDDPDLGDVALENVQARLRTLLLFTLANQHGALVIGTGDLSEKALGWSTYAGDHIANYDVNAGVPKTLIQFVIRWVANERVSTWTGDADALRELLFNILDTPISPELLPADASGKISQLTEDTIGPYELHDFFLYHFVRHGARPGRILDLARAAFASDYPLQDLKQWLVVFYSRFFRNQFKRSCATDGPKVGMVALSPRGDWRMPSDAQVHSWLGEVEAYRAD